MEIPRVNAVGVVEVPEGYVRASRPPSAPLRLMAMVVLAVFFVAGTATTVLSLGRTCLTSQASPALPFESR